MRTFQGTEEKGPLVGSRGWVTGQGLVHCRLPDIGSIHTGFRTYVMTKTPRSDMELWNDTLPSPGSYPISEC
jgi:hypothetical protein